MSRTIGSLARAALTGTAAAAVVVGALAIPGDGSGRTGSYIDRHEAEVAAIAPPPAAADAGTPHADAPGAPAHDHPATSTAALHSAGGDDGHGHDHADPTTKNALSRSTERGRSVQDPTTPAQRLTGVTHASRERAMKDPRLVPVRTPARKLVPEDRYAMANGCYSLGGEPIYFKPAALGVYLLYDRARAFVVPGGRAAEPSPAAEWTAHPVGRPADRRYAFTNAAGAELVLAGRRAFRLLRTTGCAEYPEVDINISGPVVGGTTPFQEVRGYVDAHNHLMAFEFLGGTVHCGRPWHRYGAPYALVDCPDHSATGGTGGVLESLLSGEPQHDPVGWPTFRDWPAPHSLTHETTYWRWLERAWRGGQRMIVNLFVENNQLCMIYPTNVGGLAKNSCDDMDSVRLQARRIYELQDYIDAQFGGPGEGFFRIVTSPWQAREVINAGKMAVVLGIETSVPFGCTVKLDVPQCTAQEIDRQLDEMHALGVRQMELTNKFDNALTGVAGDAGATGVAVNFANFLETGSFWDMRHCEPADPEMVDHAQVALPDVTGGQQDALFGAVGLVAQGLGLPNVATPLYPPPAHCNSRGLTDLGVHAIKALAKRQMLFDPDHMSVKGRVAALDLIESMRYPGILSSHSWSTPDAYPRIYRAGGFVTPYAGDSTGFVDKWRRHLGWADPRFYFGFGFGADTNGLGAQGSPRGAGVPNPVTYPFTGFGGVRVDRQVSGQRVYDVNVDGVAHYGLYPDWVEDLRRVAGPNGDAIVADLERGAEGFLQTWERAEGIRPDACRNPSLRRPLPVALRLVRTGMTTRQVMERLGQPYTRLGSRFRYCVKTQKRSRVTLTVTFGADGRVVKERAKTRPQQGKRGVVRG